MMPALQLAQERNGGWLSEQSFREVADALDLTPAYCLSIASFYDMFRLEPVGEHVVEVCTNISCGLAGAQQVVEAFESELGLRAGETTDGFTLRTVECLGGCGWATIVAVNNRHRLHVQAEDVPRSWPSCAGVERGGDGMATATPEIVFAGTDGGAVTEIADYEAVGGFTALAKARGDDARRGDRRAQRVEPARPRWRILPDRAASGASCRSPSSSPKPHYLVINADESEPGTFKDREIMLRVPFRFLEGALIAAHAIQSQHVFIYIRGEYEAEFEVLVDALEQMRAKKLLGDVTIVLHRGAGAYICGEETALLESLEGRRGQPRTKPPFPAIAGLYASPTAVNNVESITIDDLGPRDRRRRVREDRRRELDRHARLLALRATSSTAATTSCRTASRCAT